MSSSAASSPRKRIVDAVFRLVARGGVAEASLRKVADESGINIGSVRHYFGNHEGLMVAAAEEVGARMERRLNAALPAADAELDAAGRRELVEAACHAVLPLDRSGRAELIVLVELITAARLHPEFRSLSTRMGADLRTVFREVLAVARVPDAELEAERLTALIGGLTFDLVYPHGAQDITVTSDVLRRHITALIPE
ncbi:TetR family transcriptional regulator C-terminal domain-containing protein [Saccharopolyspora indica]|uniref:TetR/AcrR family transcriptional regulator n=1 Tax=Saccharopolyspora indica TaxID=1229659 RepID=UPI0022EA543C|nr:TetR/AcrR family transcriptional regulator [Saccharopolyspora indica]MDA3644491.1 TetR/AcrR family transcriptional regulator [Saccharopolyspora indica]